MKTAYEIRDWANNLKFNGQTFPSFEDAWVHIREQYLKEYWEEFEVRPVGGWQDGQTSENNNERMNRKTYNLTMTRIYHATVQAESLEQALATAEISAPFECLKHKITVELEQPARTKKPIVCYNCGISRAHFVNGNCGCVADRS